MIKLEAQTCQSAEEIHPLWRDMVRRHAPRRHTGGLLGRGYGGKLFELRDRNAIGVAVGAQVRESNKSEYTTVLGGGAPQAPLFEGLVSVDHGVYSPSVYGLCWVELS